MQKHNLQPATIEITNVLKKIMLCCYQQFRTYLDEENKAAKKKKKLTNQNIFWIRKLRKLEGKIDHLMESSKLLDKKILS